MFLRFLEGRSLVRGRAPIEDLSLSKMCDVEDNIVAAEQEAVTRGQRFEVIMS
jgi:hypothetical protein